SAQAARGAAAAGDPSRRLLPDAVEPHLGEGQAARVQWPLQPQTLLAPPGAVSVVFTKLFRNAMQAAAGGVVSVCLEPGRVVVDSGPGIAPELRPQVFEPGFRGKEGGSGMRPYIARVLAERYGWQLLLENRPEGAPGRRGNSTKLDFLLT
ncbi:MAG: sensor histidine kinase, partial [Gemmatimonadales bacterium]